MTIQKQCADYLRARVLALTGGTLKASHAHELVPRFSATKQRPRSRRKCSIH